MTMSHDADNPAGDEGREPMLLEMTGISVHYGAVRALDEVCLGVDRGEIAALMGPNGAGKSTVLKAIMGLAPVTAGTVLWREKELAAATHEIVKEGIAFVPQGRRVFHPPEHRRKPGDGLPVPERQGGERAAGWTR